VASLSCEANNCYRAQLQGTAGGLDNKYLSLATVSLAMLQAETNMRVEWVEWICESETEARASTYQAVGAVLQETATDQSLLHPRGSAA
jgi:hypothetical protein